MNMKLVSILKKYFLSSQNTGLCSFIERNDISGYPITTLFKKMARKWKLSLKLEDGNLYPYFIPASRDNASISDAALAYDSGWADMRKNEMRVEFANWILEEIGKVQKINFKPITLDKIK